MAGGAGARPRGPVGGRGPGYRPGEDDLAAEYEALVRAAYQVLAADPGRPVVLADVLAAAGLSTRAFYRHFRSKDDLLCALYRADAERMDATVAAAVAAAGGTSEALEAWIAAMLSVAYEPRRFRRLAVMMSEQVSRAAGGKELQARMHRRQQVILARVLERGRAEGLFDCPDPDADAYAIQAVVNRVIHERSSGTDVLGADEARALVLGLARRVLGGSRERESPAE